LAEWRQSKDKPLRVVAVPKPPLSPWQFVRVADHAAASGDGIDPVRQGVIQAANVMAATEIVVVDDEANCLWLGRLNQSRYWNGSQARLAARHIIWEHSTFLSGYVEA
jgi:hypothetical protein